MSEKSFQWIFLQNSNSYNLNFFRFVVKILIEVKAIIIQERTLIIFNQGRAHEKCSPEYNYKVLKVEIE